MHSALHGNDYSGEMCFLDAQLLSFMIKTRSFLKLQKQDCGESMFGGATGGSVVLD
jgi:hypothetical protein